MESVLYGFISGIIALFVSVFINKSDAKLKYITNERKEWREKIREIAANLQSEENIFKIENILCELEVRINPYGIKDKDNIFKDGHIWRIIEVLKKCKDYDRRKENKEVLIKYLSCLLKYDWERSKIEVVGSKSLILYSILSIVFPIVMYGNYYLEKGEQSIDIHIICSIVLIIGTISIINLIYIILQKKHLRDYFIENKKKKPIENDSWQEFFKARYEVFLCLGFLLFTVAILIGIFSICILIIKEKIEIKIFNLEIPKLSFNVDMCKGFIAIILIYAIFFAGIVWYDITIEVNNYADYYDIIKEISPKIENDSSQTNEGSQETSLER